MNEYFPLELGGINQWVAINGNPSKPILLLLHGGPGTPCMGFFKKYNAHLLEHFLMVTWDQRGTGRSYSKELDLKTLTLETIIKDTHELTNYLKQRFEQSKIYLLGHSFGGATLALSVIKERPSDYHAYFAVSQFVNTTKNELFCYNFVYNEASRLGHTKVLKKLDAIGKPVDGFYTKNMMKDLMAVKQLVSKYKGDSRSGMSNVAILLQLLFFQKSMVGIGFFNSIKGINASLSHVGPSLRGIAYDETHLELDVPVYFFSGDYDQLTPQTILRDYYDKIKAPPYKELHLFHMSAHSPLWEEADKFHQIMDKIMA